VVICLCFEFVFFFLINILDLYFDLLMLYQKAKCPKIIKFFFEKNKICTKSAQILSKTGPKSKLKSSFKTAGYKDNNR
jgi:hypothetical protein